MPAPVVLVNPNRIRPPIAPLGLEYLADALADAGIAYTVVDQCFADGPVDALHAVLLAQEPLLVAVTFRNTDDCYCATQHSFLPDLASTVADIRSLTAAPIVLGGAGYSVAPVGILRRVGADFGIRGDGERPLAMLARALLDGCDATHIPGLVFRDGDAVRENPPVWSEVRQRPLSRSALDNGRYFREGGQAGIETKRGCPMSCVYCADELGKGSVVRVRRPEAVAEEMLSLAARGVDCFHNCDAEFNCDPEHAAAVCRALIDQGAAERLTWYAYCSPTPFSAELASLMRRAGCVGVNFGADSGNAEMLRALGRIHTPADIADATRWCRGEGMAVMLDLLIGLPGETETTVAESIAFLKGLRANCFGVALGVRVYPGTALSGDMQRRLEAGETQGFRGRTEGNDDLAMPLFFLAPELGDDPVGLIKRLIDGDQRFFFGWPDDEQAGYNYDDNPELTQTVRDGARGAYWDILRRLRGL